MFHQERVSLERRDLILLMPNGRYVKRDFTDNTRITLFFSEEYPWITTRQLYGLSIWK